MKREIIRQLYTCSLIGLLFTSIVLILKSTPIVEIKVELNEPSAKRINNAVFPTPDSPTRSTLNKKSLNCVKGIFVPIPTSPFLPYLNISKMSHKKATQGVNIFYSWACYFEKRIENRIFLFSATAHWQITGNSDNFFASARENNHTN